MDDIIIVTNGSQKCTCASDLINQMPYFQALFHYDNSTRILPVDDLAPFCLLVRIMTEPASRDTLSLADLKSLEEISDFLCIPKDKVDFLLQPTKLDITLHEDEFGQRSIDQGSPYIEYKNILSNYRPYRISLPPYFLPKPDVGVLYTIYTKILHHSLLFIPALEMSIKKIRIDLASTGAKRIRIHFVADKLLSIPLLIAGKSEYIHLDEEAIETRTICVTYGHRCLVSTF